MEDNNFTIKSFDKSSNFYKELFFLSIFQGKQHFCQIIDYDVEKLSIKLKKYDYTLRKLSKIILLNKC